MKFYEGMIHRLYLATQHPSLALPKTYCDEAEKYCSTYMGHGIFATGVLLAIYTFKKNPNLKKVSPLFYIGVTVVVLRALNFLLFQFFNMKDPSVVCSSKASDFVSPIKSPIKEKEKAKNIDPNPMPESSNTLKALLKNFDKEKLLSFPEYVDNTPLLKQYLTVKEEGLGLSLYVHTLPPNKEEEQEFFQLLHMSASSTSQLEILGWKALSQEKLEQLKAFKLLKSLILPEVEDVDVKALEQFKEENPLFSLLDIEKTSLSHSFFEDLQLCVLCEDYPREKRLQELQKNIQDYILKLSSKESSQDIDSFFQSLHYQYPSFLPQLHTLKIEDEDQSSSLSDIQMQVVLSNLNHYCKGLEKFFLRGYLHLKEGFFSRLANTPLHLKSLYLNNLPLFNNRCFDHLMALSSLEEMHLKDCLKIKEKPLCTILKRRKNEAIKNGELKVTWEDKEIEFSEDSNFS